MWPLIGLLRVGAPRFIATALIPVAIAVGYIGVKAEVWLGMQFCTSAFVSA
jgi:hypothetical protein